MKSLLVRFPFPKLIAIALDEAEVAASEWMAAPWGLVEISSCSEPIVAGRTRDAVAAVLQQTGQPSRGTPVALALPDRAVFFSTRPIHAASMDLQPQNVLREALQASPGRANDMLVDLIKAQPGKRRVASIAACDRSYLEDLVAGTQRSGGQTEFVEPGPCALLRVAEYDHPNPRRRQVVLRVFLNDGRGLAILVAGAVPVVWRGFTLPRGDEAAAILAVTRSLETVSKYCGLDSACEAVVLHGRSDLEQLLGFDWLQEQLGIPVEWFDGPALDPQSAMRGMALRWQTPETTGFNLARGSKPQTPLLQLVPWGQVVLQGCLLLCLVVFLLHRSADLNRSYAMARARNAEGSKAGEVTEAELLKEKADLEARLAALRRYQDSKVVWTRFLHRISVDLPDNLRIQSFQGENELDSGRKKTRPKKQLVLRGEAPLSETGSLPHEIDKFLNRLHEFPYLAQHFPNIELSGLQHIETTAAQTARAYFTITCLPKTNGPAGRSN